MKRWLLAVGVMVMFAAVMTGCSKSAEKAESTPQENVTAEQPALVTPDGTKPIATITMKDGKKMVLELDPTAAHNTVNNFIELAQSGFYDGLTFHRVISGFMIQGGDPSGDGTGGPDFSIKGEFLNNGIENPIKHVPGVISMARAQDPNSAGSQFFIMHGPGDFLDGDYAAFGRMVEGLDVVEAIASVEKDSSDKPLTPVVIDTITIELNGYEVIETEKIK